VYKIKTLRYNKTIKGKPKKFLREMTKMRKLKFGVEVEFFGITKDLAVQELKNAGIYVKGEYYNHNVQTYWKVVTDSSVNSNGTGSYDGLELVSPILYDEDGLEDLEKALNALSNAGAKVDKSCGIHVHHDVSDFELVNFKNIYTFYYEYKNVFDSMLPSSRRAGNNVYCKTISEYEIKKIRVKNSIHDIYNTLGTRYKTLNIESYVKYGTIEFRQHSGSLEFEKVANWIELTFRVVEYSASLQLRPLSLESTSTLDLLQNLRHELKIQGTNVSKWIGKRIKKLSNSLEISNSSTEYTRNVAF